MSGTKDESSGRGNWTGPLDFILSTIGFCVGLGNIWRFPYKAYDAGGGIFLIPCLVILVTFGLPLYFLELSFGQFGSTGPISIWKAVPVFKGIGYAMVVVSGLVCIYYNMIIAYALYYLFASFTSELPWRKCKPEWVKEYHCVDHMENYTQVQIGRKLFCNESEMNNMTHGDDYISNCTRKPATPAAIFWEREVLDMSTGIDDASHVFKWDLCLCLLFAWVIVFLCLIKGIKSSGKVVYVTAIFPYIILTILLVKNATLPGAIEGIKYFIIPESIDRLKDADVWYSAAVQIFYSLGIAFGGLETMGSYNKFKNNIYRDAIFVVILNCCTILYVGFVLFCVLGYISERTGLEMKDVAQYGPGLIFVTYPEGLATMNIAPLWSILFFLMILTGGLDSQFVIMETVITAIVDEFRINRWRHGKLAVTGFFCLAFFLLGLPQCTRAGIYVVKLFDWYSAGFSLFVVSFLEIVAIPWVYGLKRFSDDIKLMIGKPCCGAFKFFLFIYWWPCWLFVTPAMILFLVIFSGVSYTAVSRSGVDIPVWADGIGWAMVAVALVFIPLLALIQYCKAHNFYKTIYKIFRPDPSWGPALEINREGTRYENISFDLLDDFITIGYSNHKPHHQSYAQEGHPAKGFDYVANGAVDSSMTKKSNVPPYNQQDSSNNERY